jgi:hypothetical protein
MQIDDVSRIILHVQSNCHNLFFFQMYFFLIKCAPFFLKIGEGISIDDYKAKALEIGKFRFKMHLNIFVSNVFVTLKITN